MARYPNELVAAKLRDLYPGAKDEAEKATKVRRPDIWPTQITTSFDDMTGSLNVGVEFVTDHPMAQQREPDIPLAVMDPTVRRFVPGRITPTPQRVEITGEEADLIRAHANQFIGQPVTPQLITQAGASIQTAMENIVLNQWANDVTTSYTGATLTDRVEPVFTHQYMGTWADAGNTVATALDTAATATQNMTMAFNASTDNTTITHAGTADAVYVDTPLPWVQTGAPVRARVGEPMPAWQYNYADRANYQRGDGHWLPGEQFVTYGGMSAEEYRADQFRRKLRSNYNAPRHIQNHRGNTSIRANRGGADFSTVSPQEIVALQLLRKMVAPDAFKNFLRRGIVSIAGPSGLVYAIERKSHLIEVYRKGKLLSTLCVYLKDHKMPPTDEVVAKMVIVQCDEHDIWRRANINWKGVPADMRVTVTRHNFKEEHLVQLAVA